jgi:hypothetical protein
LVVAIISVAKFEKVKCVLPIPQIIPSGELSLLEMEIQLEKELKTSQAHAKS